MENLMKLEYSYQQDSLCSDDARLPTFAAFIGERRVTITEQPSETKDSGQVRLGTTHLIWEWLFGRKG